MKPNAPSHPQKPPQSNPKLKDYNEEGVDLTLIRWMLSLSPAERLHALQQNVRALIKLRDAKSRA